MIKIQFSSNLPQVRDKFVQFGHNLPIAGDRAANELAKTFRTELIKFAPSWRGDLKQRITVIPESKGLYAVKMPKYGYWVDEGTKPHFVGGTKRGYSKLQLWSKDKGLNFFAVRANIAKYGTQPHPFIRPALYNTKQRIAPILKKHIKYAVKNSRIGKK